MRYLCILNARRPALLALALATATSFLALVTCNDDGGTKPDQTKPTARLISQSDCKPSLTSQPGAAASECSQDCVEIWSESEGVVRVRHIDAGFNCCIDSVVISVEIKGHVALVTETEVMQAGCHCLCLYDIEYEIRDLPSTVNKIEFVEPYADPDTWPDDEPLCCSFPTPLTDTVSCCVMRCHYPWGIVLGPRLATLQRSECRSGDDGAAVYYEECVDWKWLSPNVLELRHTNVPFNCCLDSLHADMTIHGDTIEFVEREITTTPCDCICLYDLTMRIEDLVPGTYVFVVRYGVWDEGIPKLTWIANLIEQPTGQYCRQ